MFGMVPSLLLALLLILPSALIEGTLEAFEDFEAAGKPQITRQ